MELPLLRLGVAGFAADQLQAIERALAAAAGEGVAWELGDLDGADAWWLNGARTQVLDGNRIRVAAGVPGGRSVQVHMPDVDRPIAFATPLPLGFAAPASFDPASATSMRSALQQFEAWLAPITAQFCVAANIVEHQSALGTGRYELRLRSNLLAVVDMRGDVCVRATAGPADFEGTHWVRCEKLAVPEHFARASLTQLMWQYTERTSRDVLPKHYRNGLLYFRRAPYLPQRLVKDSHLLIMRELMLAPATFEELQQRCGIPEARLARKLASLYFAGSITSNPKRAARATPRASGGDSGSDLHSDLDSVIPSELPPSRRPQATDLTAPAPLRPDH